MVKDLSHGVEKPEVDDTGDVWLPAVARNAQRLNDHNHNGTNSPFIPLTTQTLDSGDWALDPASNANSQYSQTVTVPNSRNYDDVMIQFRLSDGTVFYPSVEKQSATTYKVYINDNSQSLTVLYR